MYKGHKFQGEKEGVLSCCSSITHLAERGTAGKVGGEVFLQEEFQAARCWVVLEKGKGGLGR